MGVPIYWGFPVTGRPHGLAAAPGHGKVALGPWDIRERLLDIRESPLDIRERPLDSRERPLDSREPHYISENAGVGWGRVFPPVLASCWPVLACIVSCGPDSW